MNNQMMSMTEQEIFAYIGRLALRVELLERQLVLLQQQIAQGQQAQTNGQPPDTPGKAVEVAKRAKA